MFTRALHYELKEFGIHVQCQVPLFVTTKLAKLRKTSLLIASPAAYARLLRLLILFVSLIFSCNA